MVVAIIIAAVTCAALAATVLLKPEVQIKSFSLPLYPLVALAGAIAEVAFTPLTVGECWQGMIDGGAVNPLKILALFISVTAISVFLDEAGFFEYLACKVLKKAGNSQLKLFFLLYATVSVLTVFTSNDVIILTFTPFIIYFCKNAKIKPTPYLVAEFTAANTWSMALIIGNPTNIYIATAAGYGFIDYIKVMLLPTLFAGLAALGVLFLIFRKDLKQPAQADAAAEVVIDKPLCIIGLCVLGVCTVSLAVSGYVGVEMWLECVICAGVLFVTALFVCLFRHKKPIIVGHTARRVPYQLIPFVLSMFVVALSLEKTGATAEIARLLSGNELILYGVISFLSCNLVNNIPMSVLFTSVISAGQAGKAAVFATVIGSNLGALLTPVGALAGIMFSSITAKRGAKFSGLKFIKYGSAVSLAALAAAIGGLAITLI